MISLSIILNTHLCRLSASTRSHSLYHYSSLNLLLKNHFSPSNSAHLPADVYKITSAFHKWNEKWKWNQSFFSAYSFRVYRFEKIPPKRLNFYFWLQQKVIKIPRIIKNVGKFWEKCWSECEFQKCCILKKTENVHKSMSKSLIKEIISKF